MNDPNALWCVACLRVGHLAPFCPEMRFVELPVEMPPDPDDTPRAIQFRTAMGQYRRLCVEGGIAIPPDVLALDPDRELYAR